MTFFIEIPEWTITTKSHRDLRDEMAESKLSLSREDEGGDNMLGKILQPWKFFQKPKRKKERKQSKDFDSTRYDIKLSFPLTLKVRIHWNRQFHFITIRIICRTEQAHY